MLIVKIELHSAVTGRVTTVATGKIVNTGTVDATGVIRIIPFLYRVGRYLAHELEAQGHTIAVIDRNPDVYEDYRPLT